MNEIGNAELVRLGFEMFEREGPAAALALADPDVEIYAAPGIEPTGRYVGKDSAMRWTQEWFEVWEEFRMEPMEFIEPSEGVVVVPVHQVARGKSSGVEVEIDVAYLFEIRDGLVTRFHIYPEKGQALTAANRIGAGRGGSRDIVAPE
jgi:ketosteroid isomerase-like protein